MGYIMAKTNGKLTRIGVAPTPEISVLSQFIADLSFENLAYQHNVDINRPFDTKVELHVDSRRSQDAHTFQVSIKLNLNTSIENTGESVYCLELDYVSLFKIPDTAEDELHPVLLVECPRLVFPFLRKLVFDITREGGFTPLNLDSINFRAIYDNVHANNA